MRFKEISIDNLSSSSNYSKEQGKALKSISKKINEIGSFFDLVIEFENLFIKNIYSDYLNLIKIRENRSEIEKIGDAKLYINDYFIPSVEAIENKIQASILEWDSIHEDDNFDSMKERMEKLKLIKRNFKEVCDNCEENLFVLNICNIIDLFANFKIYRIICLDSNLERIEQLLKFKNDLMTITKSGDIVKEIKSSPVSIDDL